jgi:hypothetical protein
MDQITDILLTDIRHVIAEIGKDGGQMSPSIYDTAQVARLAPPEETTWPALEWLLDQQQGDGGWGNPAVPRARDVPTLATVLALLHSGTRKTWRTAAYEGIAFLRRQADQWAGSLPDELPVGVELLLPRLLDEAAAVGIELPYELYSGITALGTKRRRLIALLKLRPGTTPVHSWEAFGCEPDQTILDRYGSVGHSPAATAYWLRKAEGREDLADAIQQARVYLQQASAATGKEIPGLMPTAWPVTRFEQTFALYPLYEAGLLEHPALADVIKPQLISLYHAMTPQGIGFSDEFVADSDDTSEAITILHTAGYPVDINIVKLFANQDGHFTTYSGELQPSITATAHALDALRSFGISYPSAEDYLIERHQPNGTWIGDKWNGSWLYATSQVIIALGGSRALEVERAIATLLAHQYPNGGWGTRNPNPEETAYAVLALRWLHRLGRLSTNALHAVERAERWLLHSYRPFAQNTLDVWLAKETYRPERIARMTELSAMLAARI